MARKRTDRAMDGILHDLGNGIDPIRITPIADIHIGDRNSSDRAVSALIKRIKDDDQHYAVLCGDIMNTAITGSKSDSYGETMTPQQQIDKCCELLSPIADKVLCIVPGNHEERISRSAGVDTTALLAMGLGIKDLYRQESALVFIRIGKGQRCNPICYSMYVNHGHGGGGRRAGSKVNSLQDLGYVIDADIIVAGHTHMPATFRTATMHVVSNKFQADIHEQVFVNTASAIDYGGYGMRGGYQPPSNRYPVIELNSEVKDIKVTI